MFRRFGRPLGQMPTVADLAPKLTQDKSKPCFDSEDQLWQWLAEVSGMSLETIKIEPAWALRRAAKKTHPDTGGEQSEFLKYQEAKKFLERARR